MAEPRTDCRTPNPDRPGITRIPTWKFELLRGAILALLAEADVAFAALPSRLRDRLTKDDLARLGSLGWHATVVKLELECRGEVVRAPGGGPQRLTLGAVKGEP